MGFRFALSWALLSCFASSYAAIRWADKFDLPGPTYGDVTGFFHDEVGGFYATGIEGERFVWKMNGLGQFIYRVPVGGNVSLGTHRDFFSVGPNFERFDRETGAKLWSQVGLRTFDVMVDEKGAPYVTSEEGWGVPRRWQKRSYATGNPVWKDLLGDPIMIEGPDLLIYDENTRQLKLISKLTGKLSRNLESFSVDTIHVHGLPLKSGNAVILAESWHGTVKAYAFRSDGTLVALAIVPVTKSGFSLKDGSALVQTAGGWTRIDPLFKTTWTFNGYFGGSQDSSSVYFQSGGDLTTMNRVRISDGAILASFHPQISPNSVAAAIEHGDQIWIGKGDSEWMASMYRYNLEGTVRESEWHSTSEGNRLAEVLCAVTATNNDLITVSRTGLDVTVSRINKEGALVWSTMIPRLIGSIGTECPAVVSMDGTEDNLVVSLFSSTGATSLRLGAVDGSLRATWSGFGLVSGTSLYRSTMYGGIPFTSKFNLQTGKENWRIRRIGGIQIGAGGELFVGWSRNNPITGEQIWNKGIGGPTSVRVEGNRVLMIGNRTIAALDLSTGQTIWSFAAPTYMTESVLAEQVRIDSGRVLYIPSRFDTMYVLNLTTGAKIAEKPWCLPYGGGFIRTVNVGGVPTLAKFADIASSGYSSLATVPALTNCLVTDQIGGLYLVGCPARPLKLTVARFEL